MSRIGAVVIMEHSESGGRVRCLLSLLCLLFDRQELLGLPLRLGFDEGSTSNSG